VREETQSTRSEIPNVVFNQRRQWEGPTGEGEGAAGARVSGVRVGCQIAGDRGRSPRSFRSLTRKGSSTLYFSALGGKLS
jgi:hypothetical protein